MAMDAKQRKTLMIRIGGAAVIGIALLGFLAYMLWPESGPTSAQDKLAPSDPMIPSAPQTVDRQSGGNIVVQPGSITFQESSSGQPETIVFTIRAQGAPVAIRNVMIPAEDVDTLMVTNIDCPTAPQMLVAGASCSASLTWNGLRSVSTTLSISASTTNTAGVESEQPQTIAITAVNPSPQAAPEAAPEAIPAPAGNGANASANTTAATTQPQAASGPSPTQLARDQYLAGRRGFGITVVSAPQLQAAARSPYASWDNIGVQSRKSSFPVDMTRVITPDKPLPAVLTYQIDTRQTVTAVAMIDRDIYGSSGRTVVIPRGTKVIGQVRGGATDRVGIAWTQLIRPDGVRFLFDGDSGDAMGRGGVPGRINNRYLQRYGYSLLPSLAGAGLTAALGGQTTQSNGVAGNQQSQDARAVAAQILQQPLNQIAQDIYQKNSNIPVQITIPAGTRITIWSVADLRLKPVGEDDSAQGNGAQAQGNARGPVFSPAGGGQRGNAAQPQNNGAAQSPRTQNSAPVEDGGNDGEAEGQGSSLQVGRVDANGNYIPPGSTAPPPGPIVRDTNNATAAAARGSSTNNSAPTTNRNPWQ